MNSGHRSIPIDLLREAVSYDCCTGKFTWNERPPHHFVGGAKWTATHVAARANSQFAGKRAGSETPEGYRVLTICGVAILEHRAAYAYVTGNWPAHEIDHCNGNKADNRWDNIRPATRSENAMNLATRKDNMSGVVGVGWYPRTKKWRARITVEKVTRTLGSFRTFEEARAARAQAERELGFHANHGRRAA